MSRLQELIQRLCPDGVEYKPLGDVCTFKRGDTLSSKDAVKGEIPVMAGGQKPSCYHNTPNRIGETIVVAGSGAYAGFVTYWNIPVFVSDAFSVHPNGSLLVKYVFYFLKNIQHRIYATKKGAGVPHVHGKDLARIVIPVPPLEVQEEIVKILDRFADYAAELQACKQQYEYYRNLLLTFNPSACGFGTDDEQQMNVTAWGGDSYKIKRMSMDAVFEMRGGYTPSKSKSEFWENGTIPWFRMEDIRENGRILSDAIQHITPAAVKGKGLFEADSFILATTATIGEHALLIADSLANQRFTNLKVRKSLRGELLTKYVYYYMFVVDEFCKGN